MKTLNLLFIFFTLTMLPLNLSYPQEYSDKIRLNQIGFYPNGPKMAIVIDTPGTDFYVTSTDFEDTLFTGTLSTPKVWPCSEESASKADFSELRQTGCFVLVVPNLGCSYPFEIRPFVHQQIGQAALKGFYFQRASAELYEEHAGIWKRKMGHPDNQVYIHASAATAERPKDTIISCPKGWYDAGDYNKYIVNSGITVYTLLSLYEHFPAYVKALKTNIPESTNNLPDLLDEALWNIRWMLAMQDPHDGGVYHKLTCTNFQGFIMPHQANARRYVVQKSTTATFDFAATMAQSSRIFREFENELPGLADSCLQAALKAWTWGKLNPQMLYRQNQMNSQFSPSISTGEYGDGNPQDEFHWAAMELFITTRADSFLQNLELFADPNTSLPAWPRVNTLGFYSLAHYAEQVTPTIDVNSLRARLIGWANWLMADQKSSAYDVVMGKSSGDFVWGSNAIAANQGVALLQAFRLSNDSTFLKAAISNLDYILGRNATTYSFLTGCGDKTPMNIHHRQSGADGVKAPVPGLLAGGPNPGQQDNVSYPSDLPALSYSDVVGSYASNEIAINWNAPMVYLAVAIEAIYSPDGQPDLSAVPPLKASTPDEFELFQNYPNPFNATTKIRFKLAQSQSVDLRIFDCLGKEVFTLFENALLNKGWYELPFDARYLASGLYFYQLRTPQFVQNRKMVVLK